MTKKGSEFYFIFSIIRIFTIFIEKFLFFDPLPKNLKLDLAPGGTAVGASRSIGTWPRIASFTLLVLLACPTAVPCRWVPTLLRGYRPDRVPRGIKTTIIGCPGKLFLTTKGRIVTAPWPLVTAPPVTPKIWGRIIVYPIIKKTPTPD